MVDKCSYRYNIEEIYIINEDKDYLILKGWVYKLNWNRNINVILDNGSTYSFKANVLRQDVIEYLKLKNSYNPSCGFDYKIELENIDFNKASILADDIIIEEYTVDNIKRIDNTIRYSIDNIYKESQARDRWVYIEGWAFSLRNSEKLKLIVNYNNSKMEFNTDIERQDIFEINKNYDINIECGFLIKFKVKGESRAVKITFVDEINETTKIESIDLAMLFDSMGRQNRYKGICTVLKSANKTNVRKLFYIVKNNGFKYAINKIRDYIGKNTDRQIPNLKTIKGNALDKDKFIFELYKRSVVKSNNYVPLSKEQVVLHEDDIKYICFYLPQFHPTAENDVWWGKGFTEWTNVSKAVPQFYGHHQPHLPDELGFYDLRIKDVQRRQVELARMYGIYGFCFHFYWFGGKRLLEEPLEQYLYEKDFNLPFCLCWANENWSRRWDGNEQEVLISQSHSKEDDENFICYISKYFSDSRYIRINGKPLLLVYNVSLLPNPQETVSTWRTYCKENGIGDLYLVAAQTFGVHDSRFYGFDAAAEFPPHNFMFNEITDEVNILNNNFDGKVFDYEEFVQNKRYLQGKADYKLFKTAMLGWDNTARKPNNGHIFKGFTPKLYKQWLVDISEYTKQVHEKEEQIVFINAWNEWAEGTHLEPDKNYGYAYLKATAEALITCRKEKHSTKDRKILYISHDALFHGAQLLSLNIVKVLKERFNYDVHIILKSGGPLEDEFRKYGTIYNFEGKSNKHIDKSIQNITSIGVSACICNTIISGDLVPIIKEKGVKVISLIHELPGVIQRYNAEDNARLIAEYSDKVVFPSTYVKDKFYELLRINDDKSVILPQGLYKMNEYKGNRKSAHSILRERLSLNEDAKIILAIGYGDYRKGIDLFIDVAEKTYAHNSNIYFLWIGNRDKDLINMAFSNIKDKRCKNNILFRDATNEISIFYAGADLYLMTSREDPFPSVVMDAMNVGLPVIGFEGAGGFSDIVKSDTGALVPYLDTIKMSNKIIEIIGDDNLMQMFATNSQSIIETKYNFSNYIYELLKLLGHKFAKISVIVPNYNYEKYLPQRIDSILRQTYPVYEIILLDDKSTDKSINVLKQFLKSDPLIFKLYLNEENSGNVFKQWGKGLNKISGDYVWIAEADDLSEEGFLEALIEKMVLQEDIVMGYTQSKMIDSGGNITAYNYYCYTDDVNDKLWKNDYIIDGIDEIKDHLSIKNTIPNVSAVLFKNTSFAEMLYEPQKFNVAGDWMFYVSLLKKGGKILYVADSLNKHRRHDISVTKELKAQRHFEEVCEMQQRVADMYFNGKLQPDAIKYRKKVKKDLQID